MSEKITTVETYIEQHSPEHQTILRALRLLIQTHIPFVLEKVSFGIPFYHHYGMCFYYTVTKQNYVELCLCRGKELQQTFPQLESRGRAIIAGVALRSTEDIARHDIKTMLICATEWNEQAKKLGIPMVNKQIRSSKKTHTGKPIKANKPSSSQRQRKIS